MWMLSSMQGDMMGDNKGGEPGSPHIHAHTHTSTHTTRSLHFYLLIGKVFRWFCFRTIILCILDIFDFSCSNLHQGSWSVSLNIGSEIAWISGCRSHSPSWSIFEKVTKTLKYLPSSLSTLIVHQCNDLKYLKKCNYLAEFTQRYLTD